MNIFLSTWCLVVAGLLFSFPMIYMRIRETTVLDDEFMFVAHCFRYGARLTLEPLLD
jgi:hypothetical protein